MAWIKTVEEQEATGALGEFYAGIKGRMGFVPNILKVYSLRPDVLQAMQPLYETLMFGPSGLTRAQREMIAVLVSKLNNCHY
ncbi:MAG: carboxymuconolactone decarboxylase family protein [Candidatus Methylomirabilales bacterium]